MTSPLQKLDNLIPSVLNKNSSRQDIINQTYRDNLGNNMLGFIQQLAFNVMRRNNGGAMCVPRVTWTPTKKVSLTCFDNISLYGALARSDFLRIANVYAQNVQTHKMYMHMRSQGKFGRPAIKPQQI